MRISDEELHTRIEEYESSALSRQQSGALDLMKDLREARVDAKQLYEQFQCLECGSRDKVLCLECWGGNKALLYKAALEEIAGGANKAYAGVAQRALDGKPLQCPRCDEDEHEPTKECP